MLQDDEPIDWDDLTIEELHELLAEEIPGIDRDATAQLAQLLRAAGSLEGALEIVQRLGAADSGKRSAA